MTAPTLALGDLALLNETDTGTLATIGSDGRPHLTTVTHAYDVETGEIVVVIGAGSVKARNLRRDPRVTLHVAGPGATSWLAVEGEAVLTANRSRPAGATSHDLLTVRFLVRRNYRWPR